MTTADLAFGRRVLWQGQAAEIIDIDWQRLNVLRVRIRIPHAEPRTRWVKPSELEAA